MVVIIIHRTISIPPDKKLRVPRRIFRPSRVHPHGPRLASLLRVPAIRPTVCGTLLLCYRHGRRPGLWSLAIFTVDPPLQEIWVLCTQFVSNPLRLGPSGPPMDGFSLGPAPLGPRRYSNRLTGPHHGCAALLYRSTPALSFDADSPIGLLFDQPLRHVLSTQAGPRTPPTRTLGPTCSSTITSRPLSSGGPTRPALLGWPGTLDGPALSLLASPGAC
jgi:hypothetical protein